MFNKYYQDELIYLRQLGREYAQAYPETAKLLAETGTDPDVERLLEGTAFITGRLRQKLDDELPELTHAVLETFWPQLLRPIPSLAVVQFEGVRATDKELRTIPRGAALDSVPVDGTRCRFRTCFPVVVPPLRISQVQVRAHAPCQLTIKLRLNEGLKAGQLGLDRLRLHCAGVPGIAHALHLCLTRLTTAITLVAGPIRVSLPPESLQGVGLDGDEALLDQAADGFAGFALVHEYFAFPAKFLFVDLVGLAGAFTQLAGASEILIECALARLPTGMPQVTEANLLLGCTPVANEFPHSASPIRIEPERREYKVLPGGSQPAHYEITALTSVTGVVQGQNTLNTYRPLFHQQRQGEAGGSFLVRRRPAVVGVGSECYLTLTGTASEETISVEALATNRRLPLALGPGDINHPTDECPTGVRFRNLAKPTAPVHPPLGSAMEWQLLAHLGLNYRTLAEVGTLTSLLDLYDLRAQVDQQARQSHRRLTDSLSALSARPATQIAGGVPVRGVAIDLVLKDELFDGEGEMHLFATILDRLFAGYVGLNGFSQLTVRGAGNGDIHQRPALLGQRRLGVSEHRTAAHPDAGGPAPAPGPAAPPLAELLRRLAAKPALFEFTRAIALLQAASPDAVPLGGLGPPEYEAVRLRPALELGFPTADLTSLEALKDGPAGRRSRLETSFLGLYGQASPLPAYLTESLMAQDEPGPTRDFIDIINHRLLSLAWRVLTKYRVLEGAGHEQRLLALIGRAAPAAQSDAAGPGADAGAGAPGGADARIPGALPPRLLLARAGLMSQQPRSASGLERVLSFWLEAPVAVEQCLATWIDLPPERQVRLGQANARLGVDTIAGSRLRDRTTSFLVRIGPLETRAFRRLLPDGESRGLLEQLVAEFNPGLLDYRIELLVAPPSLPEVRLGGAARLGWDTCLPGPGTEPIPIRFPSALAS